MDPITISRAELAALIKQSVQDAFRDVGLYTEDPGLLEDAREDFRFVRRLRKRCDSWVNKVGTFVVMTILTGVLTLMGWGFKAFLGK